MQGWEAERIAWKVGELLREKDWGENEVDVGERVTVGMGARMAGKKWGSGGRHEEV